MTVNSMKLLALYVFLYFGYGRLLGIVLAFFGLCSRVRRSEFASTHGHGHPNDIESGGGQKMAGISKVQKVAKKESAERGSIGTCQCGGELKWARVVTARPRMMQVCEKCGRSALRES